MTETAALSGAPFVREKSAPSLVEFIAISRSRLSPKEELEVLLTSLSLKAPRRVS